MPSTLVPWIGDEWHSTRGMPTQGTGEGAMYLLCLEALVKGDKLGEGKHDFHAVLQLVVFDACDRVLVLTLETLFGQSGALPTKRPSLEKTSSRSHLLHYNLHIQAVHSRRLQPIVSSLNSLSPLLQTTNQHV